MKRGWSIGYGISLLLWLCCGTAVAQSGIITTIAGNGVTQYIGDGSPATAYSLATPMSICVDGSGNVFSTDFASYRIRRIRPYDSVFTYAGIGAPGYTGDNGPATAATFHNPFGLVLDAAENLYVVEQYNNVVRKINRATGIITTICGTGAGGFFGDGGSALSANMEQPSGVCMDRAGNIYVADRGNHRVRKLTMVTGLISTVAGSGTGGFAGDGGLAVSARLSYPVSVTIDTADNLYIADYGNNRIRKVTPSGIISTVAGTGVIGYAGNGGLAVDAQLIQPNGVYMSKRGNLYISDYGNNVVRMVGPDGNINTVAGSGMYGYTGDGGKAVLATFKGPTAVYADDEENIYIADGDNSAIRKVQAAPVGVGSVQAAAQVRVYPNPTTGTFYVESGADNGNATLTVCNTLGAVIYAANITGELTAVDISHVPAGMYYIRIAGDNGTKTGKVMKL